MEVAESRALTAFLQEKETAMAELEKELTQTRCDCVFYGLACKGDTLFLDLELIWMNNWFIVYYDRDEYTQLKTDFEEKVRALESVLSECKELKAQLEQLTIRATNAEAENKRLVDLWMLQKMQDAERLNEVWYIVFIATWKHGIMYILISCLWMMKNWIVMCLTNKMYQACDTLRDSSCNS